MRPTLLALATVLFPAVLLPATLHAQALGDVALIAFHADAPDGLAFVALAPIAGGTTLYLTDSGWHADGTLRATEGTLAYTIPTGGLPVGTVVTLSEPLPLQLSTSGDQLTLVAGSPEQPRPLYALNVEGDATWQPDATSSNTSALPPGLTDGHTAVAVREADNVAYNGPTVGTRMALLKAIGNPDHWQGDNSTSPRYPDRFTVQADSAGGGLRFMDELTSRKVTAGETVSFVYVAAASGNPVTYALLEGPGTLQPMSGTYHWQPTPADVGHTYILTVQATTASDTLTTSATLTVQAPQSRPRFAITTQGLITQPGTPIAHSIAFSDPDGDAMTIDLVESPRSISLDMTSDTTALIWGACPDILGIYPLHLHLSDGTHTTTLRLGLAVAGSLAPESSSSHDLALAVQSTFRPTRTLGYRNARDTLYARISADPSGAVRTVYTDHRVALNADADPSAFLHAAGVNAEHTWPQSMGAGEEPQRSDLHILYPALASVNSVRSNRPYGSVPPAAATAWYRGHERRTTEPADPSTWARVGGGRFQPPAHIQGDIARAMFYFATLYPHAADTAFFNVQRATLLSWHRADPPSAAEADRSARIMAYQGTPNPFVIDTTLAHRTWGALPPDVSTRISPPASRSSIHIHVYPNPARNQLFVQVNPTPDRAVDATLYDLLGRHARHWVLATGTRHTSVFTLDLPYLAPGIYVLRLQAGGRTLPHQIIHLQ
ncbi:MAG: hypothetical protein RhofKO_32140 [Rhodothermales bacterium]